jgi:uncharacterized protein (TIGR02646 family)
MRRVERRLLSVTATTALSDLTAMVAQAADPKERAATLWKKTKPKEAFSEIRTTLKAMAGGRDRCMYCEDNEGTDIEHFWPKSAYPDKAFSCANHLLACSYCNSNCKRTKFPTTNGQPDLLDPTVDEPSHHLRLLPSNGKYNAIGPKGGPSIEVFDLNGDERGRKLPQGRKDTLLKLQLLVLEYDRLVRIGHLDLAQQTKQTIEHEPFPAVLRFLTDLAQNPVAELILRPGVAQAIERHRVASW